MTSRRKLTLVCVVLVCAAMLPWITKRERSFATIYSYSQFLGQTRDGQVASVIVIGSNPGAVEATYRLKSGERARTRRCRRWPC